MMKNENEMLSGEIYFSGDFYQIYIFFMAETERK